MFIQTHPLDDPAYMRFTPGEAVLPMGTPNMAETDAAELSPLARRLLRIEEVEAVALSLDDVTIRRSDSSEWYILKPAILGAIMEHYGSGDPTVADSTTTRILELLDDRIRPAVEAYGGEVLFKRFADGTLTMLRCVAADSDMQTRTGHFLSTVLAHGAAFLAPRIRGRK